MKRVYSLVLVLSICGCQTGGSHNYFTSTTDPVVPTDVDGEYVIQARDPTDFLSNVTRAEENAVKGATEHCSQMGKEFRKRYVLTSPPAPRKWADAVLHFRCVDKKS